MQPATDTESEVDRKDEKTPLVANVIDEGTLYKLMYSGIIVRGCVHIIIIILASTNNSVIV
jgi:hypothetical protein